MNAPLIPDIDAFEERAAIAQYEGGLTRKQAENLAAQARGSTMLTSTGSGWRSMFWAGLRVE